MKPRSERGSGAPAVCKPLDSLTAADAAAAGGKAWHCAQLRRTGVPVPDGFVIFRGEIESAVFRSVLDGQLQRLSGAAGFAVRSSASDEDSSGASFAGIHETWLNVAPARVAAAVAACRESMGSARARAYRQSVGLGNAMPAQAVLVQPMLTPDVSGVAFTADPVTGDSKVMVIGAAWGLGEAVVGGWVEADQFRLSRTGDLLSANLGEKRWRVAQNEGSRELIEVAGPFRSASTLTTGQLRQLAALLIQVESLYGKPQDVEWCLEGERFWILQSRPVTTSPGKKPDIEWTRANVREVLPDLAPPQVTAYLSEGLNQAYRRHYGRLLAPEAELGKASRVFFGRVYFNLSQLRHICQVTGSPPARLLRAMGHSEGIRAEDEIVGPVPRGQALRVLPDKVRLLFRQITAGRRVDRDLSEMQADASQLSARDPAGMSDAEIIAALKSEQERFVRRMDTILMLGAVSIYEPRLRTLCDRLDFSYDRLVASYLSTGEKSVSAQQGFDLLELAHVARSEPAASEYFQHAGPDFGAFREVLAGTALLAKLEQFLDRYGHRGLKEADWSRPRYREEPRPLLVVLQTHILAAQCPVPAEIARKQKQEWSEVWEDLRRRAAAKGCSVGAAEWTLRRMKQMYLWREHYRSELMRVAAAKRPYHLTLAARLVTRGLLECPNGYFLLTLEEIENALQDPAFAQQIPTIVNRRKMEMRVWKSLDMPLLARDSQLVTIRARAEMPAASASHILEGLCLSPGYVEGEVMVLRHPDEYAIPPGTILVAQATDPSWTPLFTIAAGVIVEVGGVLSHAATVAREYGLPAIANVGNATRLLETGMRVRLDATAGYVEILMNRVPLAPGSSAT